MHSLINCLPSCLLCARHVVGARSTAVVKYRMVVRAKNKNQKGQWDRAAEHGVPACYFIQGGLGSHLPHSDISTQTWRTWERESCGYAGEGRAFRNKSYETGEFIMCSRKSKDQCCWEGRVVWGARSSMVLEGTLSAGSQLPYEKP